jgi:hypothetical protein
MAENTVNIGIKVTKTGTGTQDTINDLKKVEAAAARASTSAATAVSSLPKVNVDDIFGDILSQRSQLAAIVQSGTALETLGTKGAAVAGKLAALAPTLLSVGSAAFAIGGSIVGAALEFDALREKDDQVRASFQAQVGGAGAAAAALSAMSSTVGKALTNNEKMAAAGAIMASNMNLSASAAANLANIAINLGDKSEATGKRIAGLTQIMATGRTAGLDAYGISAAAVATRATELQTATEGLSSVEATRQAIFAIGTQQLNAYAAAGGTAVSKQQELTNALTDYKSALASNVNVGAVKAAAASVVEKATINLEINSSDAQTQIQGLEARLKDLQAIRDEFKDNPVRLFLAGGGAGGAAGLPEIAAITAQLTYLKSSLTDTSDVGTNAFIGIREAAAAVAAAQAAAAQAAQEASIAALQAAGGIDTLTGSYYRLGDATDAAMKGVIAETKANIAAHEARLALMQSSVPGSGTGYQPSSTPYGSTELKSLASDAATAGDKLVADRIKSAGDAATKAADAVKAKWDNFANAVTTALDDAQNKAKGLFDLGGGGGGAGIVTEPGKNGPFEALYRLTDIAATQAGRAPGADTAKWQQMYAGQDATGIAKNFQAGNLLAKGVFENIDWGMLGQQAQQQQQASKISTYAGQAAANLTKAGKPLTAESMAAEIDKLAAKDKASLVPELQNVSKAVTDTGTTAATNAASMISHLATINSTLTGKLAPTTNQNMPPPPTVPASTPTPKGYTPLAGGTAFAPGGMALVGERGPELVNLPQGARVFTSGQTNSILAGLALRGFAAGTSYAPGGIAIVGERGPELVQIPASRNASARGGQDNSQATAQFMTDLAKAINVKASTSQQAADALADMLVNAAALNVQTSMLQQLTRR